VSRTDRQTSSNGINKNLATANRSSVSCAHDKRRVYRPKYYTVTLKSRLRVTEVLIIHNWLLVELFDTEYYRDLEMWYRGHSRSLKVVPFESSSMVSYSPSIVTMAVSSFFSHFGDIQHQRMARPWNLGLGLFMYDFLLVRTCNYSSILYHLRVIWRWIIPLTLKSGLEITQGHWKWCHLKAWVRFTIRLP